jgi:NAD(P)-dependent dehydrogenase (short-subunit alcohol dehydrogenase family)
MNKENIFNKTDFINKTAVVTGGGGILGEVMVAALLDLGVNVAILDINQKSALAVANNHNNLPGNALPVETDILKTESLNNALDLIHKEFGSVDFLVNAAGGNHPDATTSDEKTFAEIPEEALRFVTDLNLLGTMQSCQVFGVDMQEKKVGIIVNISSMNALRPLTRIPAYSAAKAGVSNFTQWLAVHMAMTYSPKIRVNAIAPGFFITNQNKYLLVNEDSGELSTRGQRIIDHTPANRFGEPGDLIGTLIWLLSPLSNFVTGIVLPVDGGFSAYSGV